MKNLKFILVPVAFAALIFVLEVALFPHDYFPMIKKVQKEISVIENLVERAEVFNIL